MYDTTEDAYQKLGGTYILYDNEPYKVTKSLESGTSLALVLTTPSEGDSKTVLLNDPKIDYRSIAHRLGYVNVDLEKWHQSIFLSRKANRKIHQGLCSENVWWSKLKPVDKLGIHSIDLCWADLVSQPGFRQMFTETYPSLEVIAFGFETESMIQSCAFHRLFAVDKTRVGPIALEYKAKTIGWAVDSILDGFVLDKSFVYLTETLEHNGVKIKDVA